MTITDKQIVKDLILDYYNNLFKKDASCDIGVAPRVYFHVMSTSIKEALQKYITDDDIKI